MVTINRFFCFRLHTAGVILGWLGAAGSLVCLVFYSILLSRLDSIVQDWKDKDASPETIKYVLETFCSIYITSAVIQCLSSILLIVGTVKERHLLLIPWLINNGLSFAFNVMSAIGFITFMLYRQERFGNVIFGILLWTVTLSIQFLAWLAIYSLFKLIRSSSENQQLLTNNNNNGRSAYPSYTKI